MSGSGTGASPEPYRRFEVYTGTGRRRTFTTKEKLGFVARMAGCDNISELADDGGDHWAVIASLIETVKLNASTLRLGSPTRSRGLLRAIT